ncbi:hypothetical protein GS943_19325 [Rhodococcus hoagii]|nr:hypothetical protein [Prescottella equi]
MAQCESGGNWSANTETATTVACSSRRHWSAHGGSGLPAQQFPREQIRVAEGVLASSGPERGRRADSTCDAHLSEGAVRAPGAHERSLPVGMPQPTLTADRRQGPPPSSSSWRVWCWSTVLRWLTLNRMLSGTRSRIIW